MPPNWKRLLACITGFVDQELILRNDYLATESDAVCLHATAADRQGIRPVGGGEFTFDGGLVNATSAAVLVSGFGLWLAL